jgi:hypothetical protein
MQPMFDEYCEIDEFENGINTINGDHFTRLLDICFEAASYLSLTIAPWTFCTETELEKELEPFLVKKLRVQKWFCYNLSPSNRFLEVHIYKATPLAKAILLKYFADAFLHQQENSSMVNSTQTLEDLCIFTENSLLLGTVTHEYMCHVYPPNKKVEQEILFIGRWRYIEDDPSERFVLEGVI